MEGSVIDRKPAQTYSEFQKEDWMLEQDENYDPSDREVPVNRRKLTDDEFDWPVDEARLTRGFFAIPPPRKKRPHLGIDLAAPRGTPILAAQKGMVIYTGRDFKGFGRMVLVESGYGWATLYAHLDKILVSEGQKVLPGDVLGSMGRTGRATGVHLHFEIRRDRGPVDPLDHLPNGKRYQQLLGAI
jgi:murein DD-endopeptidase MepM/ murein hydrolase activator NlpD